jgi:geranylgeranyl pyrophosphate synthase
MGNFQQELDYLRDKIEAEIISLPTNDRIPLFYQPIHYINRLTGKKLRPLLTVLCGLTVGGDLNNLLPPAAAIELLHNFSLVHDDIMDNDETRRGKPTVHVKWDIGTAILAGDGLLGLAYRKLLQTPNSTNTLLVSLFTEAMLEICEGQALDKTFETQETVTENEYLEMISKKTATLIKLACEMGAIVAEASEKQINDLAQVGYNLGMGFQIQDDLLDILADEQLLGKKVGSDLAMNKKTIATIRLSQIPEFNIQDVSSIDHYKEFLSKYGIIKDVNDLAESYFNKADTLLNDIPSRNKYHQLLKGLVDYIHIREK